MKKRISGNLTLNKKSISRYHTIYRRCTLSFIFQLEQKWILTGTYLTHNQSQSCYAILGKRSLLEVSTSLCIFTPHNIKTCICLVSFILHNRIFFCNNYIIVIRTVISHIGTPVLIVCNFCQDELNITRNYRSH